MEGIMSMAQFAAAIAAVFALAIISLLAFLISRCIRAALACGQGGAR
jgi:hypothetical protein